MAKASQYLQLIDRNGDLVRGECNDEKHLDWIMVSAWNWSVTDPAALPKKSSGGESAGTSTPKPATGTQGGGVDSHGDTGGEKVMPEVFTFSKQTDRSTTRLMTAMDNGMFFSSAKLVIEEQFEAAPHPFYLEIRFDDAFLVGFNWSAAASGAGRTFDETWKLNYSKIYFDYNWRGGNASKIPAEFVKPPDSASTASKKSPQTEAEKKDQLKQQLAELNKATAKNSGK